MVGYDYNLQRTPQKNKSGRIDFTGVMPGYMLNPEPVEHQPRILGYTKSGDPIHAASVIDSAVCGGSSVLFIAIGLGLGWLAADKFSSYLSTRK